MSAIAGIGVDLVDIARFERTLERTPRLRERLFTPREQPMPARSLAARYAAKEAFIKALGGSDGVYWGEIDVRNDGDGRPFLSLSGATADTVLTRGIGAIHVSMSHDGGFATAYVIAEYAPGPSPSREPRS